MANENELAKQLGEVVARVMIKVKEQILEAFEAERKKTDARFAQLEKQIEDLEQKQMQNSRANLRAV